ncbi:TPA: hypothetical protein MAL10_005414 [Klebsiella pneumoniae]|nr:hypothetical protein [Klebsiella pneumoniae]HBS5945235.1 hypothetical protein [Klebsiella pneumoniae]HBS7280521.1 hypothetical protein [Klebsiella pneumoniae]HBS7748358.1 hypothetical protein [Klebsiella pneumoniae]HBU1567725.1 hypothetical protein [Klebsiella pneumoniae]HBZ7518363.1 hypothetical protein [Klebsiella pneumoniae]
MLPRSLAGFALSLGCGEHYWLDHIHDRKYDNAIPGDIPDCLIRFSGATILFVTMLIYW